MTTQLPVLVLLPGMDGTGDLFAPLIRALGSRFETIVVRYPLDEPLIYPELLTIARAALPAGRDFVLVAESFSGPIGIALASEPLPGLRGLVLCSTFARTPRPGIARILRNVDVIPMNAALMRVALVAMLGVAAGEKLPTHVTRTVRRVPHEVLRARMRAVLEVDASDLLALVRAPILYLQASRDLAVPASAAAHIRTIKPDTQLVRIKGPHFLMQVRPDAVAAEIARFATAVV